MSNILLLEDDEDLAQVLSQWLDSEDISLEVCHDGHEGYARLMKGHYDLVILDWSLPGLSGLEICQKYRSIQGSTRMGAAASVGLPGPDRHSRLR